MIFLGCDGGSTKTELLIATESGQILAHRRFSGCNYAFLGEQRFASEISAWIQAVLKDARVTPNQLTAAMFGLPTYGEIVGGQERMQALIEAALPGCPVQIDNDVVVGWGGSLAGQCGIHVVSGTGSIVYAQDEAGHACRVGGWSLFFSDEGSCSWMGRQLIAAFVKQADGRQPRTQLYELVHNHFRLTNDLYFAQMLDMELREDSSKLAGLQMIALQAAQAGDQVMQQAYHRAADELVQMVKAANDRLSFAQCPSVSYTGGLFRAGELILQPFRQALTAYGFRLCAPQYNPMIGAIALAARSHVQESQLETMLRTLDTQLR